MDEPGEPGMQRPPRNALEKAIAMPDAPEIEGPPSLRVIINRATNGYTVQVMKYKPNPHGPDWSGDLLVCRDAAELFDTIKAGITISRIEP